MDFYLLGLVSFFTLLFSLIIYIKFKKQNCQKELNLDSFKINKKTNLNKYNHKKH